MKDLNLIMTKKRNSTTALNKWWVGLCSLVLLCFFTTNTIAQGNYNYAEVLTKSIQFYEAQISGPQPNWSRAKWREDSHMNDGSEIGKDLTGGWYDAGDHTKFNYPLAQAIRGLCWSYLEYKDAFLRTNNETHILNNLRHIANYLIKIHPEPNKFYFQIGLARGGDKGGEHFEWIAPGKQNIRRPVFELNPSKPGTHMACSNAAAFASLSMVFKNRDPQFSATLLRHARELYNFGDRYRGFHDDHLPNTEPYPLRDTNNKFNDDLAVGAIWLYKATGEQRYLDKALSEFPNIRYDQGWMMHYRDHSFECFLLLSDLLKQDIYYNSAEAWLDNEIDNAPRTNAGLYFRSNFLPNTLAVSMAYAAYFYAETRGPGFSKYNKYRNFAFQQMDYVLGSNPRNASYVVGFGNNFPRITHHRGAHDSPNNSQDNPRLDTHILTGALVGGPNQQDQYSNRRQDVRATEMAVSNQAFFVGLAAQLVKETGGGGGPVNEGAIEIEDNFRVVNETGGNGSIGADTFNPRASNGRHVRLFDVNDELATTFTVGEAGRYLIGVRVRVGEQSGTETNLANEYTIRVNGTVRNFTLDPNSISTLDKDTYWGKLNFRMNLGSGNHTVRIRAKANWLKADRLDFKKISNASGNVVIRARGNCGQEQMVLSVGGNDVRTWNNVGTSYSNYTYQGYTGGEIKVKFTNDAVNGCDRNLYIDYIVACGTRIESESPQVVQTANFVSEDKQILFTNGDNNYGNPGCNNSRTSSKLGENTILQIHPNPANQGEITIAAKGTYHVVLLNTQGQQVYTNSHVEGMQPINISTLANGLYFVRIQDKANNTVKTQKLLIGE